MARVTIDAFSPAGATYIGANMRQSDLDEMHAVFGPDVPVQDMAYAIAYRSAPWSYSAKLDGQPVMMFGVMVEPIVAHLGVAWGFGTESTRRVIPTVSKFIKSELIPTLQANGLRRVEVRLLAAHEGERLWLSSLGARGEAVLDNAGFSGETFHQLSWTRNN